MRRALARIRDLEQVASILERRIIDHASRSRRLSFDLRGATIEAGAPRSEINVTANLLLNCPMLLPPSFIVFFFDSTSLERRVSLASNGGASRRSGEATRRSFPRDLRALYILSPLPSSSRRRFSEEREDLSLRLDSLDNTWKL